jgi:hypothetical protein
MEVLNIESDLHPTNHHKNPAKTRRYPTNTRLLRLAKKFNNHFRKIKPKIYEKIKAKLKLNSDNNTCSSPQLLSLGSHVNCVVVVNNLVKSTKLVRPIAGIESKNENLTDGRLFRPNNKAPLNVAPLRDIPGKIASA